ncbi:polysaccharide deacetylase family protein [Selenomonadales bacterium OttesenSCG-928-I06]|nr:polysaccharide deacetylase family protein [Selenomonadales bacterium OttesenSCG-928-I06]
MKKTNITFLLVTFFALNLLFFYNSNTEASYKNGIPILLYHHVSDEKTALPELTVSSEEFDYQMKKLKDSGFSTITTEELLNYMSNKQVRLPEKPIVITFDDGYEDNYTYAFPILKKYNFKATIFMVGVNIDANKRLSTQQMKEMVNYGIEFGSHSITHSSLPALNKTELIKEIKNSKKQIEQVIKKEVSLFSYPYGDYNLNVLESTEFNYKGAVTVLPGPVKSNYDNVFLMRRIPIFNDTDIEKLFDLINKNQAKESLLDYSPTINKKLVKE